MGRRRLLQSIWLTLGLRCRVGGAGDLVVCLSRGSEPLRTGRASWALGSVEGPGDLGVASRARGLAAAVRPSADPASCSRVVGDAQSSASAPGVGGVLGEAGDIVALAPRAGGAALDLSAQEAGA